MSSAELPGRFVIVYLLHVAPWPSQTHCALVMLLPTRPPVPNTSYNRLGSPPIIVKMTVVVPFVTRLAVTFVIQTLLFVIQVLDGPTYCRYPAPAMARKVGLLVMYEGAGAKFATFIGF